MKGQKKRRLLSLLLALSLVVTSMEFGNKLMEVQAAGGTAFLGTINSVVVGPTVSMDNAGNYTATEFSGEVARGANVGVGVNYTIPAGNVMTAGTAYSFTIETNILTCSAQNIPIESSPGVVVANVSVNPNSADSHKLDATITFTAQGVTEGFAGKADAAVPGGFTFQAKFDEGALNNRGKNALKVGWDGHTDNTGKEINFALPTGNTSLSLEKNGAVTDVTNSIVTWTLTATVAVSGFSPDTDASGNATGTDTTDYNYVNGITIEDQLAYNGYMYNEIIADGTSATSSVTATWKHSDGTADTQITGANVVLNSTTKTLTWTSPSGTTFKNGDKVELKFSTKYNADAENFGSGTGTENLANHAEAKADVPYYTKDNAGNISVAFSGYDTTNTKTATADKTVPISTGSVDKTGLLVSGNSIKWTVNATNSLGKANATIKDILPKGLVYDSSQDVKVSIDGTETKVDAGKITTSTASDGRQILEITMDDSATNKTKTQTYTFYTKLKTGESPTSSTFENEIQMWGGPGPGLLVSNQASVDTASSLITKSGKYNASTHTIDWTVKLLAKDRGLGLVTLSDTIVQNYGETGDSTTQTYVDGSMTITRGAETAGASTTNVSVASVTDFSTAPTGDNAQLKLAADKKSFELKFDTSSASTNNDIYTITYQTKLGDNDGKYWANNKTFNVKNDLQLTSTALTFPAKISSTVKCESKVLEKTCNSYDYTNRQTSWTIKVDKNHMDLGSAATGADGKIVITDTLSSTDWDYNKTDSNLLVKQVVADGSGTKENTLTKATSADTVVDGTYFVSYTNVTSSTPATMTITLPKTDSTLVSGTSWIYTISYKTDLKNVSILKSNNAINVSNEAVLKTPQYPAGVKVSSTKDINKSVLNKALSKTEGRTATWTIDVNKNRADLSDITAIVSDTLSAGLTYQGVKVYEFTASADGTKTDDTKTELTEGTDYTATWDPASRTVTIQWKNSDALKYRAYHIELSTMVLVEGNYSNGVSFGGGASPQIWQNNESVNNAISFNSGWTRVPRDASKLPQNFGAISLTKTNKDGTSKLKDAQFKIVGDAIGGESGAITITTDSNGVADTILPAGDYTIEEVTAAANYDASSAVYKDGDGNVLLKSNGKIKVTVASQAICNITATNARLDDDDKGKLEITKTIEGSVTKEEAEGALSFKVVNNTTKEENVYQLNSFTYNASNKTWTKQLTLASDGYTVTEIVTDITGQTLTATTYQLTSNGSSGALTSGKEASLLVTKDQTTKLDYKNTYEAVKSDKKDDGEGNKKDDSNKGGSSDDKDKKTDDTTVTSSANNATNTSFTSSLTTSPKTGDYMTLGFLAVLMVMEAAMLLYLLFWKKSTYKSK